MAGIDIGIGANTNDFERGIKQGVVKPLDGVEDVLKDVSKAGDKAGDELEKSMKDAADATEKNEKANKELAETVKKTGRAGRDAGDDFKKGTDRAKEGLDEVKQEANSTAKEAAASFDGSAESIGDAFQEVLANIGGAFGPIGSVLAIGAAAAVGTLTAAMQEGEDQSVEFQEKVGELANEFIEAGDVGKVSLDYMVDKLKEMATETDAGKDSLADLKDIAEDTGTNFKKLAEMFAGNIEGIDDLVAAKEKYLEQLTTERELISSGAKDGDLDYYNDKIDATQGLVDKLKATKTAAKEAAEEEAAWLESGGPEMQLKADLAEGVADAYDSVRDAALDAATSEEGVIDIDAWAADVAAHKEQVVKFKENLALMALTPEQWANFMQMPESAQMQIAESYGKAGSAGKAKIEETLSDAGSKAGQGAKIGFEEGFKPETDVEIVATADTSDAVSDIEKVSNKKYEADIKVKTSGKAEANDEINKVTKDRTAKVKVDVLTGDATTELSNWINRKRTLNVTVNAVDANGKKVY